ncbi:MAG: hypothetical protein KDD53_04270 [Bdellovibrionales bacterium]|nr:hypothetical protein [Bdellovibrionales bacterium]
MSERTLPLIQRRLDQPVELTPLRTRDLARRADLGAQEGLSDRARIRLQNADSDRSDAVRIRLGENNDPVLPKVPELGKLDGATTYGPGGKIRAGAGANIQPTPVDPTGNPTSDIGGFYDGKGNFVTENGVKGSYTVDKENGNVNFETESTLDGSSFKGFIDAESGIGYAFNDETGKAYTFTAGVDPNKGTFSIQNLEEVSYERVKAFAAEQ